MSTSKRYRYHQLSSQVGGHPGVMTSEDGSLVIKPALPPEVEFYQSVQSDPTFEPLRPFIPKFYGTLSLQGQVDQEKSADGSIVLKEGGAEAIKDIEKESIVLENISSRFLKPNILDIKLGRVLYENTASPEKRAKMEKTARETTSFETGVRLTGFQVYDIHQNVPVHTPKSYGKSIKPADLPVGIARFFPITQPETTSKQAIQTEAIGTGLPADILIPILQFLRDDIAEIKDVLQDVPIQMVGGSLLIVYEADWDRAREGLKYWLEAEEEEDQEDEEDSDDEDNGIPGRPYAVKLIDFAHTHLRPEDGPDENVIVGIDTVLKLLDGRIEQVKAAAS